MPIVLCVKGLIMSISLPTNKAEKWARYEMLIKQGSISHAQACEFYLDYLSRLFDEEYHVSKAGFVTKRKLKI